MFANDSLRTLCLAWKQLDQSQYDQWTEKVNNAKSIFNETKKSSRKKFFSFFSSSLENREEKVSELYEEVERDLILHGATAIEDKLQHSVVQCIEQLSQAGIQIYNYST